MIQRKQTLFLLLALVATVVCMCLPLGHFVPNGMGSDAVLYNLWIVNDNVRSFDVAPLFAILLVTCPINIAAILTYKNRPLQSRLCLVNIFLMIVWGILCGVFSRNDLDMDASFHVSIATALPFVAMVLYFMAKKGIDADERLVRAADRIR